MKIPADQIVLVRQMLLIYADSKCVELYVPEKIRGFLHLYIGEDAVDAGTMQALKANDRGCLHLPRALIVEPSGGVDPAVR